LGVEQNRFSASKVQRTSGYIYQDATNIQKCIAPAILSWSASNGIRLSPGYNIAQMFSISKAFKSGQFGGAGRKSIIMFKR